MLHAVQEDHGRLLPVVRSVKAIVGDFRRKWSQFSYFPVRVRNFFVSLWAENLVPFHRFLDQNFICRSQAYLELTR